MGGSPSVNFTLRLVMELKMLKSKPAKYSRLISQKQPQSYPRSRPRFLTNSTGTPSRHLIVHGGVKKHLTNFTGSLIFLVNQNKQNNLIYPAGGQNEAKDQ
jgi:hypothetical protein